MAETYVALDLETTGLNPEQDTIIEIGAVRFNLDGRGEEFQTFVNPRRPLDPAVSRITGIKDADLVDAPSIEVVASDLEEFLEGSILVGHNLCGFDVPVLDAQRIRRPALIYDTQPLSEILMPMAGHFGLADLTAALSIEMKDHHRALADAEAARMLFLALFERARSLPGETLAQVGEWLTPTQYPWRGFFRAAWDQRGEGSPRPVSPGLADRSRARRGFPGTAADLLREAGKRDDIFPAFEHRPQQDEMLEAVDECQANGGRLLVEAGTGTGKSLAYLLPAAVRAAQGDTRAVISTSTINLQEQLAKKDVPAVQALMGDAAPAACQLKGRRNYLCLRRFDVLRSQVLSDEEAFLASRILVWLEETETGDRGEIRVAPEEDRLWARWSADKAECNSDNSAWVVEGSCFLNRARKKAEVSGIVVVNHSLLLSDAAIGGAILPSFDHLIVDEAHHLEDEASRQFGFETNARELNEQVSQCEMAITQILSTAKSEPFPAPYNASIAAAVSAARKSLKPLRQHLDTLFGMLRGFVLEEAGEDAKLHLKGSTRAQPRWSDVEIAWSNAAAAMGATCELLVRLAGELSDAGNGGPASTDLLKGNILAAQDELRGTCRGLGAALERDDPQRINWLELDRADGSAAVSWVPLDVSSRLRESLYLEDRSVVLTGATLQAGGDFSYMQQRLGLDDCDTLALGSPFDYSRQAILLLANDMPDPNDGMHTDAVTRVIHDVARAVGGKTLALFTSNSALKGVHRLGSEDLRHAGITVLGQGIDGSARQLVRALQADPATVLLGTASFWEGVDIPGEHLSVLVITRLPFPVPTDPVHAARAEQYEDPFSQYTLPQAVIRFKQGFGRLIRTRTDRGVVIVLDPRLQTRSYGETFLQSIPRCPIRALPSRELPDAALSFLESSSAERQHG